MAKLEGDQLRLFEDMPSAQLPAKRVYECEYKSTISIPGWDDILAALVELEHLARARRRAETRKTHKGLTDISQRIQQGCVQARALREAVCTDDTPIAPSQAVLITLQVGNRVNRCVVRATEAEWALVDQLAVQTLQQWEELGYSQRFQAQLLTELWEQQFSHE